MAYDEALAQRVRQVLATRSDVSEKRMFGGLAFLIRGRMGCGVVGERLMVRVGAEDYPAALARPHVSEMDFTGRPMRGFVYVHPEGIASATRLRAWVERAVAFAVAQPARPANVRGRA